MIKLSDSVLRESYMLRFDKRTDLINILRISSRRKPARARTKQKSNPDSRAETFPSLLITTCCSQGPRGMTHHTLYYSMTYIMEKLACHMGVVEVLIILSPDISLLIGVF